LLLLLLLLLLLRLAWLRSCLLLLLRKLLRVFLIPQLHGCRRVHIAISWKRLANDQVCWSAVVHIGKLRAIGARCALVLHLRLHRRGVGLMAGR